ncbi:MAG: RtcB family protein [Actinomycetota bacterium]
MYVIKSEEMKVPLKVFSTQNSIEEQCIEQMVKVSSLPFLYSHTALMPDGHLGIGASIGSVVATKYVVIPSLVGVDIGCGMVAVKTSLKELPTETIKEIMGEIRKAVPVGFNHHKEKQEWEGFDKAPDIEIIQKELQSAQYQIGTLGGGNHFIEIQKGDDGFIWIMLHSGSRNFGLKTATEYHKKALALCEKWQSDVPDKELSFLPIDTKEGEEYFKAMTYCVDFALANRKLMMDRILDIMSEELSMEWESMINIAHNYATLENHFGKNVLVHRKGATKATQGLTGIIPGSMGTTSYIVEGLGNEESFKSCSHGAGRKMGRNEARRTLNLEKEQKKMESILGKPRSIQDLDEAPGAYKDIDTVMANQQELVKIKVKLIPLAVIKG